VAQHFLLSAAARTLSVKAIARMSDAEATAAFRAVRFAESGGRPVCPYCAFDAIYEYRQRAIFKCKRCEKQFSLTSGTPFHSRKMPIGDILLAIFVFTTDANGSAALRLGRYINCSYKTAFVLFHKLREAVQNHRDKPMLTGEVEIDGAVVGGFIRPKNVSKERTDLRKIPYRSKKQQSVVVLRQRGGETRTAVLAHESHALPFILANIAETATVYTDGASHWHILSGYFELRQINHKVAYSTPEACTNGAENYFSILRRSECGIYHRIAGKHLAAYAAEFTWRVDSRRLDNGTRYKSLLALAARPGRSKLRNYWHPKRLAAPA